MAKTGKNRAASTTLGRIHFTALDKSMHGGLVAALRSDEAAEAILRKAVPGFDSLPLVVYRNIKMTDTSSLAEFWGADKRVLSARITQVSGFRKVGVTATRDRAESNRIRSQLGHERVTGGVGYMYLWPFRGILVAGLLSSSPRGQALREGLGLLPPATPLTAGQAFARAGVESGQTPERRTTKKRSDEKRQGHPSPPEGTLLPGSLVAPLGLASDLSSDTLDFLTRQMQVLHSERENLLTRSAALNEAIRKIDAVVADLSKFFPNSPGIVHGHDHDARDLFQQGPCEDDRLRVKQLIEKQEEQKES